MLRVAEPSTDLIKPVEFSGERALPFWNAGGRFARSLPQNAFCGIGVDLGRQSARSVRRVRAHHPIAEPHHFSGGFHQSERYPGDPLRRCLSNPSSCVKIRKPNEKDDETVYALQSAGGEWPHRFRLPKSRTAVRKRLYDQERRHGEAGFPEFALLSRVSWPFMGRPTMARSHVFFSIPCSPQSANQPSLWRE